VPKTIGAFMHREAGMHFHSNDHFPLMKLIELMDRVVMQNMYHDVECAISNNRPELATIALFAYAEMIGGIGRIVSGESEEIVFGAGQSNNNFASYMSMTGSRYSNLDSRKVYRMIRGGLVHRYFIRQEAVIRIRPTDPMRLTQEGNREAILFSGSRVTFDVNAFFKDFRESAKKLRRRIIRNKLSDLCIAEGLDNTKYSVYQEDKKIPVENEEKEKHPYRR